MTDTDLDIEVGVTEGLSGSGVNKKYWEWLDMIWFVCSSFMTRPKCGV